MIKIAITGGIGSGKSYVSRMLEEMDIPVYNADNEAKRLTVSDAGIRHELTALLGEEVYQDGELNKPLLAAYLFSDPAHAAQVNAIIHPRVRTDFLAWAGNREHDEIVGMECAILYEAGFEDMVDAVVMVYAPEELRVRRAMQRDGATEAQVRARMAAQMDDEEKCRRADFVVVNDGVKPLQPQLASIVKEIKFVE
ncbi:MAG: dephospho-CoA kinase [Bacteroidales bacterium]|nr:dephospho-CoA kinase [Bacteroidales bacterium]